MPADEQKSNAIGIHLDALLVLADRVGLTLANVSILKTGKARAIRFSTLAAICRELDCQPGDLLSYKTEGDAS